MFLYNMYSWRRSSGWKPVPQTDAGTAPIYRHEINLLLMTWMAMALFGIASSIALDIGPAAGVVDQGTGAVLGFIGLIVAVFGAGKMWDEMIG